nr:MAG TPA: hypothetical protein [Crassvirales sp.]
MDKDTKDINGGVRVGTNNTSIRIGSQLIAGKEFDWSKLYDALTYLPPADTLFGTRMLIIANLSSHDISLYRSGQLTTVESGKIDWYSNGVGSNINFNIQNKNDVPIRFLEIYKWYITGEENEPIKIRKDISQPGSYINAFAKNDYDDLDYVIFIFDYNE